MRAERDCRRITDVALACYDFVRVLVRPRGLRLGLTAMTKKLSGQKRIRRGAGSGLTARATAPAARSVIQDLSRGQLSSLIAKESRSMLGVAPKKAFAMLDRGELRGTIAEAELQMLRFLRGE